ncbi:PDR/VanB family oxidoreductase [Actinomycetospora flava]|uniref:PDR/VanB family oxidoreductase n=1 Tax=Actinomycetospora flava TaxID=3129232 RepID=A0ABU8LZK5_9PSEU
MDSDRLVVIEKRRAARDVVALTLARPDGGRLPDWAPGAHIDVTLASGATRQYSLCGDRWDAHTYRVAVLREVDGRGGSAFVHDELAAGDTVGFGGPRNHFALVPSTRYLFVAGGIGITPLLPMVHQADLVGADWALLYGGRSRDTMAFVDDLARHGDRVTVHPQDEGGLLPLAAWFAAADEDTVVYCCGPGPLLAAIEDATAHRPRHLLRTERFVAAELGAPVRDEPFVLELARTGAAVTIGPELSVLEAARRAGATALSSCEQGTCGTCETPVLAGVPDHRDSILADHERAAGDCLFPCVSRSCTDRLVLDL